MRNFSAEIAKSVGHVSGILNLLHFKKKGENGELCENKNGDFLGKSTSKHPVFFADSL